MSSATAPFVLFVYSIRALAVEQQDTLIVGCPVLSFCKIVRSDPVRIAVTDELRLARLVCNQPGWPWAFANAQVMFQCHLFTVVTLRDARTDAADDARAAACPAIDGIALQRDPGTINRDHRGRGDHDAIGSRGCTQCNVMAFHRRSRQEEKVGTSCHAMPSSTLFKHA